jgi:micrococcal nuclease
MFTYNAKLIKVVDGDTVDLRIDLGFNVFTEQRFRLLGINAPETHSKDADEKTRGKAAADYLKSLLAGEGQLVATTVLDKQEKYGRFLAKIVNASGENVNDEMVKAGHAKLYDGGKR